MIAVHKQFTTLFKATAIILLSLTTRMEHGKRAIRTAEIPRKIEITLMKRSKKHFSVEKKYEENVEQWGLIFLV